MIGHNEYAKQTVRFIPLGDHAVIVRLGDRVCPQVHRHVQTFVRALETCPVTGFVECVPAFVSVTVYFDPLRVYQAMRTSRTAGEPEWTLTSYEFVCRELRQRLSQPVGTFEEPARLVRIPVCYGGSFGPDLIEVAACHGLSEEEVIREHSEAEYLVYMIGFAPGFPYLGGLSERLFTPRKTTPRLRVPAGSVGIAGEQTGVYPLSSPGGWQIIGRTPLKLFRPEQEPPTLLRAGDIVKFEPVSIEEYLELGGEPM